MYVMLKEYLPAARAVACNELQARMQGMHVVMLKEYTPAGAARMACLAVSWQLAAACLRVYWVGRKWERGLPSCCMPCIHS